MKGRCMNPFSSVFTDMLDLKRNRITLNLINLIHAIKEVSVEMNWCGDLIIISKSSG